MGEITFAPLRDEEGVFWARELAGMDPWRRLGIPERALASHFASRSNGCEHFTIASDEAIAGVMSIQPGWLAGPYLKLIAVLPAFQGQGIGSRALGFLEAQAAARGERSAWLCVSGFNFAAQRFYERHGFGRVAMLEDLLVAGEDELLYRKRLTVAAHDKS